MVLGDEPLHIDRNDPHLLAVDRDEPGFCLHAGRFFICLLSIGTLEAGKVVARSVLSILVPRHLLLHLLKCAGIAGKIYHFTGAQSMEKRVFTRGERIFSQLLIRSSDNQA
jgi:hypothetical protein